MTESMKYYESIRRKYPEAVSKDQFYQIAHISKATALHLLQNGLMPHETEFNYSVLSAWDSNLTGMRLFFCLHPSRCSRAAERMNNENT